MSYAMNKLEELNSKLKQYERLIKDLIDFGDNCLEELESFGSGYLNDNIEALESIEKEFKQIKGEK